jgi:hypothetical protein
VGAAVSGFSVGVDEDGATVDIRVRWKDTAGPEDVVSAYAKACGAAAEEIVRRLGEVKVE